MTDPGDIPLLEEEQKEPRGVVGAELNRGTKTSSSWRKMSSLLVTDAFHVNSLI